MVPTPRLVIVEDHGLVRGLLVGLVRERLHYILAGECSTVSEGVALCLKERPDVAIVDWMLPDGRGFDIIRAAGPRLDRTRWLMISSNEQGHIIREAIQLGIQGFVLKKSPLPTFQAAITRIKAGESFYCPESSRLLVEAMRSESQSLAVNLTPREKEILRAFANGENPKSIADRLGVSSKTVSNLLSSIREKLGIFESAALVRYAIRHGYVESP